MNVLEGPGGRKLERKKAQHQAGLEPMTRLVDRNSNPCSTAKPSQSNIKIEL